MTPTIVTDWPLSRTVCPIHRGSAPKRRCQRPSLIIITRGAPDPCSTFSNNRPNCGFVPRMPRKLAVTIPSLTCSGSPSPVSAPLCAQIAPRSSKRRLLWRRVSSSGPDDGARPSVPRTDQTIASRSALGNGKLCRRTECTAVKIAVLAPIPIASVSTATKVSPGRLPNMRMAKRTSSNQPSSSGRPPCSRYSSLVCSTPPNSRFAAWRAASGAMPRRIFSANSMSRCDWTSESRSRSIRCLLKKPCNREANVASHFISCPFRAAQEARHQRRHSFPAFGFGKQLFSARPRQRVVLGFAVVLRRTPFGGDPSPLFQAQQCRIERALVELKQIFRHLLDALRDAIAVQRPKRFESLQNNQVERALQHFASRRSHHFSFS